MRRRILRIHPILLWAFLLWLPAISFAHETDSSYCRLRVYPDRLEARVTFDIFTLQKIVPDLDTNNDNALSKAELETATSTVQDFLEANIYLELDGNPAELGTSNSPMWPLDAPDPIPRERWHDDTALILFRYDQPLKGLPAHVRLKITTFPTVGAAHRVMAVLEESGKTPQPIILSSNRPAQTFATSTASTAPANSPAAQQAAEEPSSATQFFLEGVKHILEGYDHICFLLALLVAARRLGQVALIVTAFTVAHSITLILAARGIIHLPARGIECAIAATIIYVAVENLIREPKFRWGLTFVFGLIHGFGFANVLSELTLPQDALVSSLLLFNVGVEAGQLAIVIAIWPLIRFLHREAWGRKVTIAVNVLVALLGLAWLVDRAFALEFMPF